MKRLYLLKKIVLNNRLEEYFKILQEAKNRDYRLLSLRDYVKIMSDFTHKDKIIILRHDVDHQSLATKKMFEIEKSLNATASYYFRDSTLEADLMLDIEKYGSEASFHYETIANYVKAMKISKEYFIENKRNIIHKCIDILKRELELKRVFYNLPFETIASHGTKENIIIDTPNNALTENINVYDYLGIKLEAYNQNFINSFDTYISDCPCEINNGYRYDITPLQAIQGKKSFVFLTHPNHWYLTKFQIVKKLMKCMLYGNIQKKESFKRI